MSLSSHAAVIAASLLLAPIALASSFSAPTHLSQLFPTDLEVQLSAQPSAGLITGQTIEFTLTVTNHGPQAVSQVRLESSIFGDEADLNFASTSCPDFFLWSMNSSPPFLWQFSWTVAAQAPLGVGESTTCHFSFAVGASAPQTWTFGFGLSAFDEDLIPTNNTATVTLRRGGAQPAVLPSQSLFTLFLLVMGLAVLGGLALRRIAG